jgi:hypothetical protein
LGKGIIVLTFLGTTESLGQVAIRLFEAKLILIFGLEDDIANGEYLLGRNENSVRIAWRKGVLINTCQLLG